MPEKNWPKISIITPCYNSEEFIEQTIKSILNQNYPNLEYIVMDGGSTDSTVEILKKYPQIIWFSEKDKGQSDAINKGLKKATGEILAFLNADDTYEPRSLKAVAEFFSNQPKKLWVTGKCKIIDTKGQEIQKGIAVYKNFWLKHYSYNKLLVINFISQPATFWRKEIIQKFGFFDENLHLTMDYDFWLRIGERHHLGFINQNLADFRIQPQAKGATQFKKQFHEEYETAKRYTKNNTLIFLHWCHIQLIYFVYNIIK
jgi:glycosyltransferase involved in cell wall biosynthesis